MRRALSLAAVALAALVCLPLASDAGIPVPPASSAACFNHSSFPPPPDPTGDEKFFNIPGGTPNVMVLLDTSGSMRWFPDEVPYPATNTDGSSTARSAYPASHGTCSVPLYDGYVARRSATPFDNGYSTTLMTDDPPWGLGRCQAAQAEPTTDGAWDGCLFRPTSYYKAHAESFYALVDVETTRAKVFNANPCAAVTDDGTVIDDHDALGNPTGPALADDLTECQTCLATKGYYVFYAEYRNTFGSIRYSDAQVVFRGDFLNGYPPKFVAARKVVKDLAKLDPSNPQPTDNVRLGLTRFHPDADDATGTSTTMRAKDGGQLVVPVGPDCDDSFPVNETAYATARQAIVDSINAVTTPSTGSPYGSYVHFNGSTPLAESLFNSGQYFSNTGTSALYQTLFGAGWLKTTFAETAGGLVSASWAQAGHNQHSICWACQSSSIIVVTDGAPTADNNLPKSPTPSSNHSTFNNDFRRWSNSTINCSTCTTGDLLHKVAYFLSQTDLRPDLLNGARPQNVYTYTISFGIKESDDPAAVAILRKTAQLGNGLFANTSSADDLKSALDTAVGDVVSRSVAFSSANANALQVSKTTSADAYLGRFRPVQNSMWEGHLFAGQIFDEFGQGCDSRFSHDDQTTVACGTNPAVNPNLNSDEEDGKAVCDAAFVVDTDCDPITEDASGNFLKATFDPATHQLLSTPDPAAMWWDAGKVLSDPTQPGYRSAAEGAANSRKIYTVLDLDADGKFTSLDVNATHAPDALLEFTADNAAALAPLMGLDLDFCKPFLNRIGFCGSAPLAACPVAWNAAVQTQCATQIIHFVRGWDVLDWDGDRCAGPNNPSNSVACTAAGEQRDRSADSRASNAQEFWKLGDIFHSSPVLVKAPLPKEICRFGFENQCVLTLFGSARAGVKTPLDTYALTDCRGNAVQADAYDKWRYTHRDRRQIVVVGANDGMLHAFDAGSPITTAPEDFFCAHPKDSGSGAELWAFIPPSQLPRLKKAVDEHTYFVDGNTLVRDVWVDLDANGRKSDDEFRTIAVTTERGGGIHYSALDITDPLSPKFLWTWPDVASPDAQLMGQAWTDFLPRPPPIGPVRLAVSSSATNDPEGRGWEERWIMMVNGGYDPAMVRGRGVFMLDVFTGRKLWQFTDADFKAVRGDANATMMPVVGSVAMVDIGAADTPSGQVDLDTFFDTATWTDVGGNLFVARMHQPGTLDSTTGLVTNWFAARAFETQRRNDDTMGAQRSSFWFMPANALDGPSRLMTFIGTGNREQLLQQTPTCGPDNLIGCCQAGCSVVASSASTSYGATSCSTSGAFTCSGGALSFSRSESGCGAGMTCGPRFDSTVTLDFDCGAAGDPPPMTAQLRCDATGDCVPDPTDATDDRRNTAFSATAEFSVSALDPPPVVDRFYGIWSYGRVPSRRFVDLVGARDFDDNRFTDVTFGGCEDVPGGRCKLVDVTGAEVRRPAPGAPITTICPTADPCEATSADPGWMYQYGVSCPADAADCSSTSWTDERTGAAAGVSQSCTQWASFRPTGATSSASADPCTTSVGTPTSFNYLADFVRGVPRLNCGFEDDPTSTTAYLRAQVHNAFAPPQNPSPRVVVNERGEVSYGTLRIESGQPAEKTTTGVRSSVGEYIYRLEVDRALHQCRHVDPTTCE